MYEGEMNIIKICEWLFGSGHVVWFAWFLDGLDEWCSIYVWRLCLCVTPISAHQRFYYINITAIANISGKVIR